MLYLNCERSCGLTHIDKNERLYYSMPVENAMQAHEYRGEGVRVSALASGSSGNTYLVEAGGVKLLFDAGLRAATLEHYLRQRNVLPSLLAAIFISHEHTDHISGAGALARRYKVPVVASEGTFLAGAEQFGHLPQKDVLQPGREVSIGGLRGATGGAKGVVVRAFAVSHDAAETVGFWIETEGRNIVICTDLGCETASIREPLEAADLLVLEANHDVGRLWRGPYQPSLKRRVAGPRGHLSNDEAARLICELALDGRPRTVWLAHLSAANNTPALALGAVTQPLSRKGCTHLEIAVLERGKPSHVWLAGSQEELHAEQATCILTGRHI